MKPIGSACCSYFNFFPQRWCDFCFFTTQVGRWWVSAWQQKTTTVEQIKSNSYRPPLVAGISFCFVAKFPALNSTQTLVHRREPQVTGDQVFQTKVPSIYSQHGQHFRCVSCSLREIFFLLWQGLAWVNTAMANHMGGNLVGTIMFLNSSKSRGSLRKRYMHINAKSEGSFFSWKNNTITPDVFLWSHDCKTQAIIKMHSFWAPN